MAEIDFTGKVAIVTGASRGIGRAIALALAKRGASVVGTARRLDSSPGSGGTLRGIFEAIEALGGRGIAVPAAITGQVGAEYVVNRAKAAFGRLDILVNNAGVYPRVRIVDMDPAVWREAFEVNVTAPFLMCRAALPIMIEQGSGNIFNVTSGTSWSSGSLHAAYSASKGALDRFSLYLTEEVQEQGIAVNAWNPGVVATDINDYRENGADPAVLEESVMWTLAQDASTFTGQVVGRNEFGVSWGAV